MIGSAKIQYSTVRVQISSRDLNFLFNSSEWICAEPKIITVIQETLSSKDHNQKLSVITNLSQAHFFLELRSTSPVRFQLLCGYLTVLLGKILFSLVPLEHLSNQLLEGSNWNCNYVWCLLFTCKVRPAQLYCLFCVLDCFWFCVSLSPCLRDLKAIANIEFAVFFYFNTIILFFWHGLTFVFYYIKLGNIKTELRGLIHSEYVKLRNNVSIQLIWTLSLNH